jgi:hypothetical protein
MRAYIRTPLGAGTLTDVHQTPRLSRPRHRAAEAELEPIKKMPIYQSMFALPPAMLALFDSDLWPSGFVSIGRLPEVAPFLEGMQIEFVGSKNDILSGSGGVFGRWKPLGGDVNDLAAWHLEKMGRGSREHVPGLPWIDVEKALIFGGGNYGDELAIALDYRLDHSRPRVVANALAQAGWPAFDWVELAPDFAEFWMMLDRP